MLETPQLLLALNVLLGLTFAFLAGAIFSEIVVNIDLLGKNYDYQGLSEI